MRDSNSSFPGIDPFLLDRYLAGDASLAERARVVQWVATAPEAQLLLEELSRPGAFDDARLDGIAFDGTNVRERVEGAVLVPQVTGGTYVLRNSATGDRQYPSRIAETTTHGSSTPAHFLGRGRRKKERTVSHGQGAVGIFAKQTLRIGWSIALVGIVFGVALVFRTNTTSEPEATTSYTTHAGQQAHITLRDGTHLTLAPRTRIRLVHAGTSSRTVVVDGEAYFDVAQSSHVPFIVQAGYVTARVLGTGFMVRYRQGDRNVHVAVADGKVLVTSRTSRWTDVPLAEGSIGDFGDSTIRAGTIDDLTHDAEWRGGKLLFRRTRVAVVLQTLSRWYGYQFQCADAALAQQDVTIAINMRSSSDALAALEDILRVNLTIVGDTITLKPQPLQKPQAMSRLRTYDVWIPIKEAGR